jgi:sugar phosphate isomerase/epimerase
MSTQGTRAAVPQLVLAHGSLRTAGLRERVAAVAEAGFDGLGLHVREYGRARSEGWSDADLRALLADHGVRLVEIETALGWDDPPDRRDADGLRREELAFALADAVGARHLVAVGALTGDLRPSVTEGFAALCDRAAGHGLLVALEPQACSTVADLDTAAAIVTAAGRPNGGLNLDVWHQTRGGWPLTALRALPPEHIVVIQIDDGPAHRVSDDYLDECTRYRTAPGEGDFDLRGFLTALLATGTTAPVSVEVLSDEMDRLPPERVADLLAVSGRRALAAAGVPAAGQN